MNKIESPFIRCCAKVIPLAFDESMSYYEVLCSLTAYLKEKITPALNETIEGLEELESYVKNYFDNLDVQQEINNKLDEMAESGQLTEIVTAYLQIKGILAFDTIADMKLSDNLVDGSFAKTYGKSTLLDGEGRFYKVREILNTDVVDEVNIIALDNPNLIAELIPEDYLDEIDNIETEIGDLDNLETTDKSSIVNAINEVNSSSSSGVPSLKGKNVIVIGDSLSINGRWGTYFINYSECNGENYGNGSAGFLSKGITSPYQNMDFNDMLNYIINNKTTDEKNSLDYLIVGGGINDALNSYTPTNIGNAVQTFITTAKTNFPNAKIIIIPINTFKWLKAIELDRFNAIIDTCKSNGVMTNDEFIFWLSATNDYNSGDNIHLTDAGYQLLAHYMLTVINGGTITNFEDVKYTLNTNWSKLVYFGVHRKGNVITMQGVLHYTGGSIQNGDTLLTFDEGSRITASHDYNKFLFCLFYSSSKEFISGLNVADGVIKIGRPIAELSQIQNPYIYINGSWIIGMTDD